MPSDRKYLPIALLAIVVGFTAVGATIQSSGKLVQADPSAMALTVADYLRGPAAPETGTPSADVKTQAQSGAEAVAQVLKSNLPAAAPKTATGDPNRIQLAAQAVATQLKGPPPAVAAEPVAIASPPVTAIAAASLAQWLNGTTTAPATPAAKTAEVAAVTPVQSEVPATPPALPTAQILQDQALKDKAGEMADAANKEFGAILKKLPSDDIEQTARADVAAAVAFSSLRYDATGTDSGLVTMSGRAKPGSKVALYLDGQKLATTPTANNGRWLIATPQKLPVGQHVARVDVLDAAGKSAESAAYPFAREAAVAAGQESVIVPLTVASLKGDAPAPPTAPDTSVAEHDPVVIKPPKGSGAQVAETLAGQAPMSPAPAAKPPAQAAPAVVVAEVPAAKTVEPVAPAAVAAAAPVSAKPAFKLASAPPAKRHLRQVTLARLTKRQLRPVQIAAKRRHAVSAASLVAQLPRKQATRKVAAQAAPAKPVRSQIASVRPSLPRQLVQLTRSDQLVLVRVFRGKHAVTLKVPQGIMRSYAAAPQPMLRPVRKRRLRRRCPR